MEAAAQNRAEDEDDSGLLRCTLPTGADKSSHASQFRCGLALRPTAGDAPEAMKALTSKQLHADDENRLGNVR